MHMCISWYRLSHYIVLASRIREERPSTQIMKDMVKGDHPGKDRVLAQ